jgi:predicted SAM-dependent methyltransferase
MPNLWEETTPDRRLNVGCGMSPLADWTNLDADPERADADIYADALEHLQLCDDAAYDDIYAGHFLEHLDAMNAATFLAECYRVLAPGGRLGIVVPDMREVLTRWFNGTNDALNIGGTWYNLSDLDDICAVFLYSNVQHSRHQWAYELDTLARALGAAGFGELTEIDRYRDPRVACGVWFQCGLNGIKGGNDGD